jgi:hypothetical protein
MIVDNIQHNTKADMVKGLQIKRIQLQENG